MGAFKPALDAHWKPYLEGKTTLDEALLALAVVTVGPEGRHKKGSGIIFPFLRRHDAG